MESDESCPHCFLSSVLNLDNKTQRKELSQRNYTKLEFAIGSLKTTLNTLQYIILNDKNKSTNVYALYIALNNYYESHMLKLKNGNITYEVYSKFLEIEKIINPIIKHYVKCHFKCNSLEKLSDKDDSDIPLIDSEKNNWDLAIARQPKDHRSMETELQQSWSEASNTASEYTVFDPIKEEDFMNVNPSELRKRRANKIHEKNNRQYNENVLGVEQLYESINDSFMHNVSKRLYNSFEF
jgi:hypothetical protein